MSYQFTSIERSFIQTAYDNAIAGTGSWAAVYETISFGISSATGDAPDVGVDAAAWVWVNGAHQVNAGVGDFSVFIRAYSAHQYELRNGDPSTISLQAVSNQVARAVAEDILATGLLPSLGAIGAHDAGATIAGYFDGDRAGWSGNPLFLFLGDDSFYRSAILHSDATDSLHGDTYDIFAWLDSAERALEPVQSLTDLALKIYQTMGSNGVGLLGTARLIASAMYDTDELIKSTYGVYGESILTSYTMKLGNNDDETIQATSPQKWFIHGGHGDDVVQGGTNDDILDGGVGADILSGGAGKDTLVGGGGDDILSGAGYLSNQSSADIDFSYLHSEWEDDTADILSGGAGYDTYLTADGYMGYNPNFFPEGKEQIGDALNYVDIFDGSDASFIIHGQADVFGIELENWTLTAATLQAGLASYDAQEGTYTFENADIETFYNNTDTYTWDLVGRLIDTVNYGSLIALTLPNGYFSLTLGYLDNIAPERDASSSTPWTIYGSGTLGSDDTDAAADTATATAASDNAAFNDQILAGNGQDTIYAFSGDDTVVAATYGGGDDLFYGGDGNDTVDYSGSSTDLQIALYDDTEGSGIASGVGIDTDQLFDIENAIGGSGNDVITGSEVANTLIGGDGDDILSGNGGADILDGGAGNDHANYDGLLSDYSFSRNADGSVVAESELYGVDVLKNIEVVWFSGDGSYHNLADLAPDLPAANTILGTSGDDHLVGTTGNDVIDSLGGNDYVNGGEGSDTYLYSVNHGDEYVDDEAGSTTDVDVLKMTDINYDDVTFSHDSSSSNLVLTVNSTSHVITFDEQYYSASEGWGLEKIEFANGMSMDLQHSDEVWKYNGSSGDDHVVGAIWGKQDIFQGGHGNDYLSGEAGSDTYVYSKGDGSDLIYDNVGFTVDQGNTDVLQLTDLNQSDLTFSRNGDDLEISVNDTGETITVDRQFQSTEQDWGVEKIEFADGSSWDLQDIWNETAPAASESNVIAISGTNASASVQSTSADIITFPTSSLTAERSDAGSRASDDIITETENTDASTYSADIISFEDFIANQQNDDQNSDLWFEPEPIGALI